MRTDEPRPIQQRNRISLVTYPTMSGRLWKSLGLTLGRGREEIKEEIVFSTIYFPHSSFRRVNNGWLYSLCKLGCGFTLLKVT